MGFKKTFTDENGKIGTYEITSSSYLGDTSNYGQVYVTSYYDGDASKLSFVPVNSTAVMGTEYLGSEVGYIKNAGVAAYQFGKSYYEADAGNTFTFKYTYGNEDYYTGKVYAAPNGAYYPGWKSVYTTANESGKVGNG